MADLPDHPITRSPDHRILASSAAFSPDASPDFFDQFPAAPAVFALRASAEAEPYVSKTADLRRRLKRLLSPVEGQSKRLNLRDRVTTIEWSLTGSDFESTLLLYKTLRKEFPATYQKRLRLRPAPLVKLDMENSWPRAYVTTRLGRLTGKSAYYGPFRSRVLAEKFVNDSLDLFKVRRCTFELNPDPSFPGCVYSEMKMCLAPCFKGCTDEAYAEEVARVQAYFDSGGQSLLTELESERERLSSSLDFESAAQQHARITKLKGVLAACDEIYGRLEHLDAVLIQPTSNAQPSAVANAVTLFRFHRGQFSGPLTFSVQEEAADQSGAAQAAEMTTNEAPTTEARITGPRITEARMQEAIDQLASSGNRATRTISEELALLKRWYYRTHKTGEIFFANNEGRLPLRRIANAVSRVARGEKSSTHDAAAKPS